MVEYMPLNQTESNQVEENMTGSVPKTARSYQKWVDRAFLVALGVILGFLLGSALRGGCAAREAWYTLRLSCEYNGSSLSRPR